ncbi:S8 family peptidase [Aquimarina sp. 2304DJ70-9]|uniref:S8 family peptidase n=1 Tax=Aquimarina penaris TaxID=3231044 RepID=UPI003461A639
MKKIALFAFGLFLVFSCSKDDPNETIDLNSDFSESQKLLSKKEINNYIESQLREHGDVIWQNASDKMLFSAVMHGGGILSVGFGKEGESFSIQKSSRLIDAKKNILNIVRSSEDISKSDGVVYDYDVLNAMDVQITDIETIKALKSADQIRYLDPIGYESFLFNDNEIQPKSFGCDRGGITINSQDYRVISPNAWLPWNFDIHKVPQAWNYSTGMGITVGLIDTGISSSQNLLGSGFNDGFSAGRTVERFGTFDGSNSDQCGHGTSMASAIGSPRNDDGMPVGVAYNSNLVAYRGTGDVLLESSRERRGVSNALRQLGDRGDVRIISMSIGYLWSIGSIKDAVRYAHSRGKLIIAAGGTSTGFTSWYPVIFPASMSETVAVTGIKDNGYNRCNNCHSGRQIDFTIVMQRSSNNSRTVPVIGFNTNNRNVVGGSSVATATTAGIAALVWARNPNMNRDQVLDKLKRAGEFYPNRNRKFGYGNIDALKAVQ